MLTLANIRLDVEHCMAALDLSVGIRRTRDDICAYTAQHVAAGDEKPAMLAGAAVPCAPAFGEAAQESRRSEIRQIVRESTNMGTSKITVGEFLYDAEVRFTDVVAYGVSLEALLSGDMSVPTAGARFDIHFRGVLRGPRLSGTVVGIDYLYMRADGRAQLHIHGQITSEDSHNIAFFADGVVLPQEGTTVWQLRENVSFITAAPAYLWLNQLQGWGRGTVDPGKGEVTVKAYAA